MNVQQKIYILQYTLISANFHMYAGEGKFGRVTLVQMKATGEFAALKILSVSRILRRHQVEHVRNERNIMRLVDHPFILKL